MLNIRTLVLSIVLVLILAGAIYFAVAASPPAESAATTVPAYNASWLGTQELRDILNGRYERRCCGLPY